MVESWCQTKATSSNNGSHQGYGGKEETISEGLWNYFTLGTCGEFITYTEPVSLDLKAGDWLWSPFGRRLVHSGP